MNVCIRTSTHMCFTFPAGVESLQTLRSNWAGRINNDEHWPSKRHRCSLIPSQQCPKAERDKLSLVFFCQTFTTQAKRISSSKNFKHSVSGYSKTPCSVKNLFSGLWHWQETMQTMYFKWQSCHLKYFLEGFWTSATIKLGWVFWDVCWMDVTCKYRGERLKGLKFQVWTLLC